MNRKNDFDRTLEAWLRREAPPEAPDRVLDAALERVAAQSQRRSWLQRLLGETQMASLTRVGALTVVLALAALVGLQLANLAPDFGAPSPSPSEVGMPSTSATPSAVPTASLPAGCVSSPDVETLSELIGLGDVVACYRNAPLTFDALLAGGGAVDCPGSVEPAWLYCPDDGELQLVGETRKLGAPFLLVVVDPTSGVSLSAYRDTNVRVTGHFDDPAAQTCREIEPFPGESPRPAAEVIESCRNTFVVTQLVPLEP